jgi:ABC-2 type transport system permease protein
MVMLKSLRSEVYRLRRRWMPYVMLAVIAVAPIAIYVLIYVALQGQRTAMENGTIPNDPAQEAALTQTLRAMRPDQVQSFGLDIVGGLANLMLIVFAASHVGTEFNWGTLRTLLAHGASRGGFLAAKLLSIALFAVLLLAVGTAAAVAGSLVVAAISQGDMSGLDLAAVMNVAARGFYTQLPLIALAALLALWFRSAGAGIAGGLVLSFTESTIGGILVQIDRSFANIVNYGISRNAQAIMFVPGEVGAQQNPTAVALPDPGQAAIVLAIYTTLFIALGYWRLRTRDVTLG